jgi:16S rRNA (cytidine1402-2'-O)-methyltransferase
VIQDLTPGLYVVATPIGNLEDVTLRALRVLKEVSVIACEDTRQTQKLLNYYDIHTPTITYHEHNEVTRSAELILKLEGGERVALVSDAGTPGISDPGYRLITLAVRHHIRVIPIPGAVALVAALVGSGLPTDSFQFAGFLSAKRSQRRTELEALKESRNTHIFYEAPHRIVETLEDVAEVLGREQKVVIAREVTKMHEEFLRGEAGTLFDQLKTREGGVKGEITLLIAKADQQAKPPQISTKAQAPKRLAEIMAAQKLDEKAALKVLAKETGVSKSELYRELQRRKR